MSRARSVADLGNQNVLDLNANAGTLKVGAGVTIENTGEVQFAGIVTAATVQVGAATTLHSTGLDLGSGNINSHNITSTGNVTVDGNLDVAGVLTYEDVTSVDSIGIITARSGIDVGTGTSISSPSSNVLTLGTAGSEKLRIDSAGNVAIGTQSPVRPLHIQGTTDDTYIRVGNNSGGSHFGVDAGGDALVETFTSGKSIRFLTSGAAERASIDSAGRLLVGTSSSSNSNALLKVQSYAGNTSAEGQIAIACGVTNPSSFIGALLLTDSNDGLGAYVAGVRDGGTWTSGSSHPTRLVFSTTANNSSSPTERMRIDNAGKLVVTDIGSTEFLSGANSFAQAMISSNVGGLIINSVDTTASSYCRLMFTPNGNITGNEGLIRYNTNDYHMSFWTQAGERMRIDSNGDHYIHPGVSNYGGSLFIGANASPSGNLCAARDSNKRPLIYLGGAYPEITFAHSDTSNSRHGSIIRFANYVASTNTAVGSQFVLGTNGQGTFFEIGYANAAQNLNSHYGFDDYPDGSPDGNQGIRIDNSGRVVKKNQPGFLARRLYSGDNRAIGAQEWAISGTASFNTGNHFNTSNGRFTAPVAGRYLFSAQPGYKQTGHDYNVYLYVNGAIVSELVRFIDGGDDLISHSTAGCSVVYNLAANDYVYVYVGAVHHVNTTYNYFCGYLLG